MDLFDKAEASSEFLDNHLKEMKDLFYSRDGFYPSLANFLNEVRDKMGADFVKRFRMDIMKFYQSQEIVQVFQPPPLQDALKRKEGYYPKIISFYPFERLYADTGKIRLYSSTRKPIKEKVDKTDELTIKLYDNKKGVKDTAFIEIKDSTGKKYRFEKRIAGDIPASQQWINDNILQPYMRLTSDTERDDFLKNKKSKK